MASSAKSNDVNFIPGAMPDSFFRKIVTEEEIASFRKWAVDNYDPTVTKKKLAIYHPIVREEWSKIADSRGDVIPEGTA